MITQEHKDTAIAAVKGGSAWAGVAVTSWSELASMLAALYTTILILEWTWKRFARPYAESQGWVARKRRRSADTDDDV